MANTSERQNSDLHGESPTVFFEGVGNKKAKGTFKLLIYFSNDSVIVVVVVVVVFFRKIGLVNNS